MKTFANDKNNLRSFAICFSAVMALVLGGCGRDKNTKRAAVVSPVQAPIAAVSSILFTCALKQDPTTLYYVYKNSNNQMSVAKASDAKVQPVPFDLLDQRVSLMPIAAGDFGGDLDVAWVKAQNGESTVWLALVANSKAKTVEVLRFSVKIGRQESAISTSEITADSKILFSSTNCQEGKLDKDSFVHVQKDPSFLERLQQGADKVIAKTEEAVEAGKAKAKKLTERARSADPQAMGDAAVNAAKVAVEDVKREFIRLIDTSTPSKEAVDVLRQLFESN